MTKQWVVPTKRRPWRGRSRELNLRWATWPLDPPSDAGYPSMVAPYRAPEMWPAGHAQAVWERVIMVVNAGGGRLPYYQQRVTDELKILGMLGQHVTGCEECRRVRPGDISTAEQWLWSAVERVPRLASIARPIDRDTWDV